MQERKPRAAPLRSLVLLLGALLAGGFAPVCAQSVERGGGAFYGKFGVGFSDYTGDFPARNAGHPFDLQEFTRGSGFPFMGAAEVGYQFTPNWALGVGFQAGNYPIAGYGGSRSGIADSYRFTPQLLGRYTFGWPGQAVAPYLDLGVNATFGGDRPPTRLGYGPSLGGGIDILVSRSLSFYLESRFNFTLPDDAIDGAAGGTNDAITGPFDSVNQLFGFGLKVRFATPTAPQIAALDGPGEVQTDTSITFMATVNEEAISQPVRYRWQFGDGETGSGLTTTHAYDRPGTYTVTFTARNRAGSVSQTLTVEVTQPAMPPRIASLDAPKKIQIGESASFSAEVNTEGAARPLTYQWQFGDGTTSEGRTVSHTYEQPGTYTAVFTARNGAGEANESVTVAVTATGTTEAPEVVSIEGTPNPVGVGESVRFRSTVMGGNSLTRRWDFGDGATATGTSPTHTYDEPGQYTVRLEASNGAGTDAGTLTVQVTPAPKNQWAIVVASMSTREGAEKVARTYRNRFEGASLSVTIRRAEVSGEPRYRVAVGPFANRSEAEQARSAYQRQLPSGAWLLSPK